MEKKKKIPVNSVGKIIKEAREKQGLRDIDLVWKINKPNITLKTVRNWENGKEFPDLDMIYELSYLFNLNPNQLLDMKNTIQKESRKEPNWSARRIGDKILTLAKPGYNFFSFLSKVLLAILLVLVYKYIHATYEAADNPTVLQTQEILGEYLNEYNETNNNLINVNDNIINNTNNIENRINN